MELYDKAYFTALKERIKELDKSPILTSLIYLIISIIFFFVWSNIILEIPILLIISLGMLIPSIRTFNKKITLIRLIITVTSIISFIIWLEIVPDAPFLIIMLLGLLIPFILLFSVVKKEHTQSLLVVIGLMSSTIYFELFDLAYYYVIYLEDPLKMDSDICPICEIENSIQLIAISIIAILLMTLIKLITTKFALSKSKILLALFLPSAILWLRILNFLF